MLRSSLAAALAALLLTGTACSTQHTTARSAADLPRFELRGLKNEADRSEYSTSFMHRGTLVAMGDSVATRGAYLVLLSVKRVGGGDPDAPRDANDNSMVFVRDGVGEFAAYGGYRLSTERWEPEKIEVQVIGAIPIIAIADTMRYRN